ncbi:Aldo/keto reductase [Biscogniauxia marginata]|nr:Aldo/keto reductase [Biscogniauxia marginata]
MPLKKPLPATGFGLLGMTWRAKVTPDEQAFAAMKAAIANGATIWSSSSIYGSPPEPPTAGLWLLRRYFEKYPEDADKVTLFIRACSDAATLSATNTREGVRASAAECNAILGPFKKMDIFGPARMDPAVPMEETMGALKELLDEGAIGAVGLSEVRAETIRKANALCPISVVEVEFSLWSTDILTNGVAETCKELDIPILTYAPLGYGFLTGQVRKLEDIPKGDLRLMTGRFQPENFYKNIELVDKLTEFAKERGATTAQLALAWIRAHSNNPQANCGTIIPIPGATAASRVEENCKIVELKPEEKAKLDDIIKSITVSGGRQIPGMDHILWT